ncbi:DUF6763 family protein [Thiohalomonas denitrificans]|uniref:DUF6763 family protein n=1 Tax=Thiohalomonas denitrificans TaxID=415747 RepID=UPI0026EB797C|nr:DUF6763 family protein [Thiohalomonas denitrificans]
MADRQCEPRIGEWHKNEQGISFEVITVDDEEQLIEIQYFDGSVEELDFNIWRHADFTSRESPEEWSGLHDFDLELDNVGEGIHRTVWSGPLDAVDFETELG